MLPAELQPSFAGNYIQNLWEYEAGIGTGLMGGVNPSSGWINITTAK